ncbi:MAG: PfkB family carbohydrate kinase [Enterocloster bolteae]
MKNNECCEVVDRGRCPYRFAALSGGSRCAGYCILFCKTDGTYCGGRRLNAEATVITRLGHKVRLVSCVGDDVIGSLVLEHCRKNNIGTEYIKVDSSKVTSINVGLIRGGWRADIY